MIDEAIFAPLDEAIREAPPEERAGLVVRIAARLATLGAGLVPTNGPEKPVSRNLSAREAADRLGIKRPTLYKHANEYPFTRRIGKRVVFDSAGLEAWNKGQRPS